MPPKPRSQKSRFAPNGAGSTGLDPVDLSATGESSLQSPKKQAPLRKNHFITWFYKDVDPIDPIVLQCKHLCYKGLIQSEICPTTNRKHIHFMLWGKQKFRDTQLKLPPNSYKGETLADKNCESNYAQKDYTHDGFLRIKWGFPEEIKHTIMFNTWQNFIVESMQDIPDNRTIHWFWSARGKMGKTSLIRYLVDKCNAQYASGGKYTDIMNLIYHTDMDKCRCVIFALPREHENHISYSALEAVKDGMVSNMKSYKNGSKIFNPPHIFVFANYPPDDKKLSQDRWNIICLDKVIEIVSTCVEKIE